MPPKKKFIVSSTVRFSRLEVAIFHYFNQTSHRTMVDEIRAAIRFYARHHPQFDADDFAKFVRTAELHKVKAGPEQDAFIEEVGAFLDSLAQEKPKESDSFNRVSGVDDKRMNFRSKSADFDLED